MPEMSQQCNAKIVENSEVLQCWTFKKKNQSNLHKNLHNLQFMSLNTKEGIQKVWEERHFKLASAFYRLTIFLYLAHEMPFWYKYIC